MRFFYNQQNILTSHLFSLTITQNKQNTRILMRLFTTIVNTRDIPTTFSFLEKFLPSILVATCYNDDHLPFVKEVKSTEIGHLFEHVLLEYLCMLKLANGCKKATFRGETNWNWKKDTWGTFHIYINAGIRNEHIFQQALEKSVNLLHVIMQPQVYLTYALETFPVDTNSLNLLSAKYKQM